MHGGSVFVIADRVCCLFHQLLAVAVMHASKHICINPEDDGLLHCATICGRALCTCVIGNCPLHDQDLHDQENVTNNTLAAVIRRNP